LFAAARNGAVASVEWLLQEGADMNATDVVSLGKFLALNEALAVTIRELACAFDREEKQH